jgi:carboxylesterase type B
MQTICQCLSGSVSDVPPFIVISALLIAQDGGGYNLFSATGVDATPLITTNGNKLITVAIQYRLGAFGFLPGDEVKEKGALNAGLLDMNFALQWVQKNIRKFGGDPGRVTIGGESAGAGAVMYQAMAYGGKSKPLFQNVRFYLLENWP